jgi:hypothetical protein
MANDDWRITVEVEGARDVAGRLSGDLSDEAQELAGGLKGRRLSVSVDDETLFIYCNSPADAEKARAIVEAELQANGLEARTSKVEHWLEDEERWDDEPPGETWEQEELDQGFAPWEVRVACDSPQAARDLAAQLETEGYKPLCHSQFLIVGAASHEDAEALAMRLHGEVEAGGEVVLEARSEAWINNPFAIFGGFAQ